MPPNFAVLCDIPGVLKQVKDHVKACAQCQSKRSADDISGFRVTSRSDRSKEGASDENEEEEGADLLFSADSSPQPIIKGSKTATKHELVFVRSEMFKVVMITEMPFCALCSKSLLIFDCISSLGGQQGRGESVPVQTQPDYVGKAQPPTPQ